MEKLANLDMYDDPKGEVLRKRFPDPSTIPPMLKEGNFLSEEERNRLPDKLFALVIKTKQASARKFPITDKANTGMSVLYFMDHGRSLMPEQMQKVAAKGLLTACHWYGLKPPEELTKIAGRQEPPVSVDPIVEIDTIRPEEEKSKRADYCLPEQEKYPISSHRQIEEAAAYFEKHASRFEPRTRRKYCKNLEKRASEVGIELSDTIRQYASSTPAEAGHIREQISRRMEKSGSDKLSAAYSILLKRAGTMTAPQFASSLEELDKIAGLDAQWDSGINDPWLSVFALQKTATYSFSDTEGYITDVDLKKLGEEWKVLLKRAFDDDFVDTFAKDPVGTFKALPLDQKKVVIKFAKVIRKP